MSDTPRGEISPSAVQDLIRFLNEFNYSIEDAMTLSGISLKEVSEDNELLNTLASQLEWKHFVELDRRLSEYNYLLKQLRLMRIRQEWLENGE